MKGPYQLPETSAGRREFLSGAGLASLRGSPSRSGRARRQGSIPLMRSRFNRRGNRPTVRPNRKPPLASLVLSRMGFGPRPGDIEDFLALGSNDDQRLLSYVEQQLAPDSIDDSELEGRLQQAGYTTLGKSLGQLWNDHVTAEGIDYRVRIQPLLELERATFMRILYSRSQLAELLADFWHNHFNVFAWDFPIFPIFVSYDRDVIRANLLGNFRQMLEAVASSPAMLFYLDNFTNSSAGPNENYARELFELHTLGDENYLGVLRQSEVPLDEEGRPAGYVDDDVFEATRCFTGWTVAEESGSLTFRSDWHDRFQKSVLGQFFPPNQPEFQDGKQILDLLSEHPGTGRHIARKLVRRLVSDDPPEDLVQEAAQVFSSQKDSPDQLAQVVRTILLSPHFRNDWGNKVKRPLESATGFLRACGADLSLSTEDRFTDVFLYLYSHTQQSLFNWRPPDGYPDDQRDWLSGNPVVHSWRLFNWLVDEGDEGQYSLDILGSTPASLRTAPELADYWIERILGRPMSVSDRREIVDFMAQGRGPDIDLRRDVRERVQERLRSMVALIGMSPEFFWR